MLVAKLTSSDWGTSKVLVISGGSLLCNYSLTKPINQELVANLLQECGDQPGKLGYMTTGYGGANVKSVDQEISRTLGLETLTTWPLNVIMLNLALIGFIACMILLPIFGRPKRMITKSSHDFADHLDAVAALMYKSGGEPEARRRISDYMRRVRGEHSGPWVMAEIAVPTPSLQKAIDPMVLKPGAQESISLKQTVEHPIELSSVDIEPSTIETVDIKPTEKHSVDNELVSGPAVESLIEPNPTNIISNPSDPPLKDAT